MAKKRTEDNQIVDRIRAYIAEGDSHCSLKHQRIEENQNYERGEQWSKGDMERQALKERPAIPNNSIIKIINAIANREIIDRFEPRIFGRSDSDNGIAEILDASSKWQRDQSESEHDESQAFRSAVASGYGVMHKWFNSGVWDGEGKICDEEIQPWSMLWPARARKMNLVDRRWHVHGKTMSLSEAEYYFGDISPNSRKLFKKIRKQKGGVFADTNTNSYAQVSDIRTRTLFGSLGWSDIAGGKWYNLAEDEVFVVEAEWIEPTTIWRAAIPVLFDEVWSLYIRETDQIALPIQTQNEETGEMEEQEMNITRDQLFGPDAPEGILNQLFDETNIMIFEDEQELDEFIAQYTELTTEDFTDYYKVVKEEVKYAVLIDDVVLESGTRPYGFTFEFITGWRFETREKIDFYGVIDVAKGPQDFKNAILSNMLATYMTSPKNTLLIEKDALDDADQFLNEYARPVGIAFVKPGFITSGKWKELDGPTFPPMQNALLGIAYTGVEELFGLSSIDLGTQSDLRRVSGTVVQAAKTSGNTIVAVFFDSWSRYRKRFGLLNIKFLSKHYSPKQLLRIIGEENAPKIQNLSDTWDNIFKYDIIVEESPVSASEKMELLTKLQTVGSIDSWLSSGYVTFPEVIQYLIPGIPENFKNTVLERLGNDSKLQNELSSANEQIQQLNAYIQLFQMFMKQQGLADQMKIFESLANLAKPMADQLMQEQMNAQEEQAE